MHVAIFLLKKKDDCCHSKTKHKRFWNHKTHFPLLVTLLVTCKDNLHKEENVERKKIKRRTATLSYSASVPLTSDQFRSSCSSKWAQVAELELISSPPGRWTAVNCCRVAARTPQVIIMKTDRWGRQSALKQTVQLNRAQWSDEVLRVCAEERNTPEESLRNRQTEEWSLYGL